MPSFFGRLHDTVADGLGEVHTFALDHDADDGLGARWAHDLFEAEQRQRKILDEAGKAMQKHREIQEAGAKANVESYKLLKQQLEEQTEINQRLEREFKMNAREAVITRQIAYWSLAVGIVSLIVTVITWVKK